MLTPVMGQTLHINPAIHSPKNKEIGWKSKNFNIKQSILIKKKSKDKKQVNHPENNN